MLLGLLFELPVARTGLASLIWIVDKRHLNKVSCSYKMFHVYFFDALD